MRGFKIAAIIYLVAEFFLTPDIGLVQSHAQSGPFSQPVPGDAFYYQSRDTSAQDTMVVGPLDGGIRLAPNSDGSINTRIPAAPMSLAKGSFTLTNSSATYLPPQNSRQFLAIDNESATIAIACAFGGAAAVNTGGSWTIPAGATRTWPAVPGGPVPTDAINCIAASGSPTITIQVQ